MIKEFDSNLVYIKKYLRVRVKSSNRKINTNSHNKMPKEDSIPLSAGDFGSVFRAGKNCYLQVFRQECKCIIKEKDFLLYYC